MKNKDFIHSLDEIDDYIDNLEEFVEYFDDNYDFYEIKLFLYKIYKDNNFKKEIRINNTKKEELFTLIKQEYYSNSDIIEELISFIYSFNIIEEIKDYLVFKIEILEIEDNL